MIDNLPPVSSEVEEDRIRAAYARRQVGSRYSLFNPGHLFMMQDRERHVLAMLQRHGCTPLSTKKILEVGCGTGYWFHEFLKWGACPENLTGVDLLPDRVTEARHSLPETVTVLCGSATRLEFLDASFDLVLQSTVFTSILDPAVKEQVAGEMLRVLKPDGVILWYDYHLNNPSNPDVCGVKKREVSQLFPGCEIHLQRITLAPPLSRALAPYSWLFCHLLSKIPILCTHYFGVIRKGTRDD
jgi:ubiquinone/menaquinone biosynthesis C-methylase UbiE